MRIIIKDTTFANGVADTQGRMVSWDLEEREKD